MDPWIEVMFVETIIEPWRSRTGVLSDFSYDIIGRVTGPGRLSRGSALEVSKQRFFFHPSLHDHQQSSPMRRLYPDRTRAALTIHIPLKFPTILCSMSIDHTSNAPSKRNQRTTPELHQSSGKPSSPRTPMDRSTPLSYELSPVRSKEIQDLYDDRREILFSLLLDTFEEDEEEQIEEIVAQTLRSVRENAPSAPRKLSFVKDLALKWDDWKRKRPSEDRNTGTRL
jgi:hypothetical protein